MKDIFVTPEYEGIIFDLDGTLVDTVEDLTDSLNVVLDKYGIEPVTYEEGKRLIGHGMRELIKNALPRKLGRLDSIVDEAVEQMKGEYMKRWVVRSEPYRNVLNLLEFCNRHEIPIGVSSNKPDDASAYILDTLFPTIKFKAVIGHREGTPHKPEPSQTLEVAARMGVRPERVLYVGDSLTDYQTAINCSMKPVLVSYGYGKKEEMEDLDGVVYIDSPLQVIDVLKYGDNVEEVFANPIDSNAEDFQDP